MQPQLKFNESGVEQSRRIVVEILRKTRNGRTTNVQEISQTARTTSASVITLLSETIPTIDSSKINLNRRDRLALVSQAIQLDALHSVARALSWQEFEEFIQNCLESAGFSAKRGIVLNDGRRRWQIDVVAVKERVLLSIDCKHWESSNSPSRFTTAIEHQRESLSPLIRHMRENGDLVAEEIRALPVIATIFEPREQRVDDVLFIAVGQFADFLDHLSPYNAELPFRNYAKESPI